MSDSPQDELRERRRTGPLGDREEEQEGRPAGEDSGATRLIPGGSTRRHAAGEEEPTHTIPGEESPVGRTRKTSVIRTSGYGGGERPAGYSRGYYEAAEEREIRLQELYGGVDWLASFLGFIFAAVAGGFFSLIAALVVGRLGFSLSFGGGGGLGTTAVTALVVLGVLLFLTYFCGGYVAGRLARFDGGRNGVMVVVWGVVIGAISLSVGPLLPGRVFSYLQSFVQGTLLPAADGLSGMGALGVGIVAGALILMLLGGFAGGRLGTRYHTEIDRTI